MSPAYLLVGTIAIAGFIGFILLVGKLISMALSAGLGGK